jgi:hypothetical protein
MTCFKFRVLALRFRLLFFRVVLRSVCGTGEYDTNITSSAEVRVGESYGQDYSDRGDSLPVEQSRTDVTS